MYLYKQLNIPFIPVAVRFTESTYSQWEDASRTCIALPAVLRQRVRYMFVRLNRKDYMDCVLQDWRKIPRSLVAHKGPAD